MLQQGVNPQNFIKMRVITYRDRFADMGIVRCFICFSNYKEGDRLKQFPFCQHVCHIKCLELWMSFEAKCPECNKCYPGLETMLNYQRFNPDYLTADQYQHTGGVGHSMSPTSNDGNRTHYRQLAAEPQMPRFNQVADLSAGTSPLLSSNNQL